MSLVEFAIRDRGGAHAGPMGEVSLTEAMELAAEGHFLAGSTGPRMASAIEFVQDGGAGSIVRPLDKAADALVGRTGTRIMPDAGKRGALVPRKRHRVSLQQAALWS